MSTVNRENVPIRKFESVHGGFASGAAREIAGPTRSFSTDVNFESNSNRAAFRIAERRVATAGERRFGVGTPRAVPAMGTRLYLPEGAWI